MNASVENTRTWCAQVHLWDVTTASVVAAFGAVDFTAKQRELFRPVSVPSWFTCETSSGLQHAQRRIDEPDMRPAAGPYKMEAIHTPASCPDQQQHVPAQSALLSHV